MNNLNNLSDDELDKLFRQSAEESDVEFDEGAWQKMNSLLNEKQPLPANWRKYSLIILAILFLGSTAVYFGNKNGLLNSFQNGKNEKSIENSGEAKSSDNETIVPEKEKPTEILAEKEIKTADNELVGNSVNSILENDKSISLRFLEM